MPSGRFMGPEKRSRTVREACACLSCSGEGPGGSPGAPSSTSGGCAMAKESVRWSAGRQGKVASSKYTSE
eukprot:6089863-Pleurochrysis_carterae.AAC.1